MTALTIEKIKSARRNLQGIIRLTPFERSAGLSAKTHMEVYLKEECLQRTGSFKLRGAYHKISSLNVREKATGIVTSSAGNHAQGVGYAVSRFKIPCRIYVPRTVPRIKLEAIQQYPVEVVLEGHFFDEAHAAALADADRSGREFIPAFDDPLIMAGHGTLGLEMLDAVSDLDVVMVPVGGGGLIAGVATAAKAVNPAIRVIGCQSIASCAMARSLAENRPYLTFPSQATIAEGLEGGISEMTFELGRRLIDSMVLVTEDEIRSAIRFLYTHHGLVVEGSGAVSVAALLHDHWSDPDCKVGVVLTGGNLDKELLKQIVADSP
ncbi:MAG: threonine/serine dehydratase [Deltaproteobacteria bacterium]|jgi:threonine dehydratase|nr:threonine/serine dehydratase [Deltaproteobacteria bacterium]